MISVVLTYWTDKVPSYGWILIFWAIYQCVSFFGVIVYGEVEFWLAVWKVICVLVGYLLAILVNTGAIGGDYIGFRFWRDPGPFANGINGFGQSFVLAAVYFSGTEMIAITAGESRNPKRDVPKVCTFKQLKNVDCRLQLTKRDIGHSTNHLPYCAYFYGHGLFRQYSRTFGRL